MDSSPVVCSRGEGVEGMRMEPRSEREWNLSPPLSYTYVRFVHSSMRPFILRVCTPDIVAPKRKPFDSIEIYYEKLFLFIDNNYLGTPSLKI